MAGVSIGSGHRLPPACGLLVSFCLLAVTCLVATAWAQEVAPGRIGSEIESIARAFAQGHHDKQQLKDWKKALAGFNAPVNECIEAAARRKKQIEEQLASLGEPVTGEAPEVRRKRRQSRDEIGRLEKRQGECRLLALRAKELDQQIDTELQHLLARELFAQGPDLLDLLAQNLKSPGIWVQAGRGLLGRHSGLQLLSSVQWLILLVVGITSLLSGLQLRDRIESWAGGRAWGTDYSSHFLQSSSLTAAAFAPHLLASLTVAAGLHLMTSSLQARPFISILADGLVGYFLVVAAIRLAFEPPAPARPLTTLREDVSRSLSRRLTVLALLVLLGYLLFFTLLSVSLPEPAFLLARSVFSFFWVLNLAWAAWVLIRAPRFRDYRWLFSLAIIALLSSLAAEWLGYRNLSLAIWRILIGTILVYGLALLANRLFGSIFDAIDQGHYGWARRLRTSLDLEPERPLPGIVWLRLIAIMVVWVGFTLAVLYVWGLSDAVIAELWSYLFNGFDIGTFHIVPVQIVWAIMVVALLITLGGWLRTQLDRHWLSHARMDRGAHEALITISGYVITTIAVLIGLSIAGVDFGNLAIIAGALSVGIGFGLQNVVNNFVSGLILLFERPIKTGDWVVVGGTEGYVKQIRIRSTQIQTFDNADVIVPNSDLISSQVTNWMLRNIRGRVKIPVTVAYGSDTGKVKEILERLAREHPKVITNGSSPDPRVLFLAFGDSALEFELRVFVHNIDDRLSVISDLNFAIDRAFREAGIEIPFPQRDLHIRDWSPIRPGAPGD